MDPVFEAKIISGAYDEERVQVTAPNILDAELIVRKYAGKRSFVLSGPVSRNESMRELNAGQSS